VSATELAPAWYRNTITAGDDIGGRCRECRHPLVAHDDDGCTVCELRHVIAQLRATDAPD
jgi:hypothetical protein